MSDYLSADELADLVGCRSNQKALMAKWLTAHRWRYVLDRTGLPKVARAYCDRKMGVDDGPIRERYATTPNLELRRHA